MNDKSHSEKKIKDIKNSFRYKFLINLKLADKLIIIIVFFSTSIYSCYVIRILS